MSAAERRARTQKRYLYKVSAGNQKRGHDQRNQRFQSSLAMSQHQSTFSDFTAAPLKEIQGSGAPFNFLCFVLQSKIFPLSAGDALIRDIRVWHGGCPNLSDSAGGLPSLALESARKIHSDQEADELSRPKGSRRATR